MAAQQVTFVSFVLISFILIFLQLQRLEEQQQLAGLQPRVQLPRPPVPQPPAPPSPPSPALLTPPLTIRPSHFTGAFDILVDGAPWLLASGPPQLHGTRLRLANQSNSAGSDKLGAYKRWSHFWLSDTNVAFETAVRQYDGHIGAVVFEQQYLTSTSHLGLFPSFQLPSPGSGPPRFYLQWDGDMAGQLFKAGAWQSGARLGGGLVGGGGPLVIFADDASAGARGSLSVVLSPLNSFMVAAQHPRPSALGYGVLPSVRWVPAGFSVETIIVAGRGVRSAVLAWGDRMLVRYGKDREDSWRRDATLESLGYATDNGAYYYYNVHPDRGLPGATYESTLLGVARAAREQRIPYRYWLADSYWYPKGPDVRGVPRPGVARWEPMRTIFPRGLDFIANATGWSLMAHNRYWAASTPYARQNGGQWRFEVDRMSGFAVPLDRHFWDNLFVPARRRWRLRVYEQDWMNFQHERLPVLTRSATAARRWLVEMGAAAADANVSIQFCMAYVRHVLQSVESVAVSQARGSGDYRAGNDQWRPLGLTSLLLYAVGLAVSKDNFWSTRVQRGSKWGDGTVEPFSALQAAVATLSRGPVLVSDKIGHTDRDLVMRCSRKDGLLLHPGTPAIMIDAAVLGMAKGRPWGEVWLATTDVSDRRFGALFGALVKRDVLVRPAEDLGYPPGTAEADVLAMASTADHRTEGHVVCGPLALRRCGKADFQLWSIALREPGGGWTLLGEVGKWIAISPRRIIGITTTAPRRGEAPGLRVDVVGAPGERVRLAFAAPATSWPRNASSGSAARAAATWSQCRPELVFVDCVLTSCGTAHVAVPQRTCKSAC